MAEIVLDNVSKSFGAVRVIDQVSLSIPSGEFVVFLGPSGSGKSTLLRMIAGLEAIDTGRLLIGGTESQGLPPGQRNVAMVFQNYALYPHMTVRENMAFGLRNIRMSAPEIDRRVTEAARMLEMGALLDRRPAALSGGQRQRVAIGRAVVKEPAAFLFDEPLSNLDAALRVRTRVELKELHQRLGSTMIYVTHDQTEAMTMADRIVILNDRRIEQIGTPMEVYTRPASRFVASFIGSPAMNFLRGRPEGRGMVLADSAVIPVAIKPPNGLEGCDLGIRPEAIGLATGEAQVRGRATLVEHLGERTLLHVRLSDGQTLIAQDIGNSKVRPGDDIGMTFDADQVHLFDAQGRAWHAGD